MKNNLLLLGVLFALLTATYFLQEKSAQDDYKQSQIEGRVLTVPVTTLKLSDFEAQKKGNSWWAQDTLMSHNYMNQLEKKLHEVKKVKVLTGSKETFFKNALTFSVNGKPWTIGEMALDKNGFYLSIGDEIMLAVVEGESTQLTEDGSEIPAIKRRELVGIVSKTFNELKENQLFRFYEKLPMEKVSVETEGRLPFELNLSANQSIPAPFAGIALHEDLQKKFTSLITQMNIKEKVPYDEKLKGTKLGQIKFQADNDTVIWELWLKDKKSADSFVIDSDKKMAFSMIGGTLKVFFIQVQDYWDKKIIPPANFREFNEIKAQFVQGSQSRIITVQNKEPLSFLGGKLEADKLRSLFQILLNLGPYDQADRVSPLSKTDKQVYLAEDHLRVTIFDQELIVVKKPEEIIVVNLTQGFKSHFTMAVDLVSYRFQDMLK